MKHVGVNGSAAELEIFFDVPFVNKMSDPRLQTSLILIVSHKNSQSLMTTIEYFDNSIESVTFGSYDWGCNILVLCVMI
jgi:hypothetical protein